MVTRGFGGIALAPAAGMERVSLASLTGTWRRRWVRWPDGREDATTEVWWVQAGRYYGDLRVPRVPAPGGTQGLATAGVEGFAGELVEKDGVFEWRRDVDFRPTGKRDVGRLRYLDARRRFMIEEGVEEAYEELWERTGAGQGPVVMRLRRAGERGWFVVAGEDFVMAVDRGGGVEVSYGRREAGAGDGVVIASTEPGRVGAEALGEGDAREDSWEWVVGRE